jgi:tRNA (mo5U34)-methyltransferase
MNDRESLEKLVWYHTLELPGGVTTKGYYDLRRAAPKVLPADLSGLRCLDVGTCNGFWAFEIERRGAAEVIGIDLDDPSDLDWQDPEGGAARAALPTASRRGGFEAAKQLLGSKVERHSVSVYDLPSSGLGEFDFAHIGNLLLHLRDPVAALQAIRSVLRPGGTLLTVEPTLLALTIMHPRRPVASMWAGGESRWWTPNVAGHRQWVRSAGFEIEAHGRARLRFGAMLPRWPRELGRPRFAQLVWFAGPRQFGVPGSWIRARNA